MKTLQLEQYPVKIKTGNAKSNRIAEIQQQPTVTVKTIAQTVKRKRGWFNEDAPENLTVKEAVIRGAFVILMPMLSAIDWHYGTYTLFFIAPIIFYLEVTAFTQMCPIKALFSNYTHPTKYE